MPIPDFNTEGVLPPFNGDHKMKSSVSPYPATVMELCGRFCTSRERRTILEGFLRLRALLRELQYDGFQWVDGPFLQKEGKQNGKPVPCLRVVTFSPPSPLYDDPAYLSRFEPLKSLATTRKRFLVDHSIVLLNWKPVEIIECACHWMTQFSHQEETRMWKGLLRIDLSTPEVDAAALRHLESLESL